MTQQEFNEKYKDYIEEGFYGLEITIDPIIQYIDAIMEDLIKIPNFKLLQIKLKFDSFRFYTRGISRQLQFLIEDKLNLIYEEFKEENKEIGSSKECETE